MEVVELLFVAVGLSMDAFAVALCKGLCMKRLDMRQAVVVASFFGAFQALMPVAGWFLGAQFADAIAPIDHLIVFALLLFVGGKMLVEAVRGDGDSVECPADPRLDVRELLALAVATSIDALAVGVGFAFLCVKIILVISKMFDQGLDAYCNKRDSTSHHGRTLPARPECMADNNACKR